MKKLLFTTAIVLGAFAVSSVAQATTLSYDLNLEYSGGVNPGGPPPWMTLTFDDNGGTGSVNLTISSAGLIDNEIAEAVYFNFTDAFNINNLQFTANGGNTATETIFLGTNSFEADGGGSYDILLDYPPPPGQGDELFGAGESLMYTITSIDAITASSFDFLAAPHGGNGIYHAAAHIQRIGAEDGSGWIGDSGGEPPSEIPEPATMLLFGTGLVGLAGVRRRIWKK